jgi:hypothetical protein
VSVCIESRMRGGSALPDIGWTAATMCLGIAYATLTAATNEVACGYGGQCDGRQRRYHTGHHHVRKRRLGLKGPRSLAI